MKVARCGSCEAPMLWSVTSTGARMPLDADPVLPDGAPGHYVLVKTADDAPLALPYGLLATIPGIAQAAVYMTHYATCLNPERHRRKKSAHVN